MASPQIKIVDEFTNNKDFRSSIKLSERFVTPPHPTIFPTDGSTEFVTKQEFEKSFEFFYQQILFLRQMNEKIILENSEYKKKISHLEMIVQQFFTEIIERKSHDNVTQLRQVLELPHISEKIEDNIIDNLDGLLEDLNTDKKSAIELLLEVRGE
jgi:hypothetical protein